MEEKNLKVKDGGLTTEENNVSNPVNFIYTAQPGKVTITLERILYYVSERHNQIQSLHGFEAHPYYYMSLDFLGEILKKDTMLSEDLKNKTNVDEALKQMIDDFGEGKHKYGYLYPVLVLADGKVLPRIVIISPQVDSQILISPFRQNCFLYSLNVIEMILRGKIQSSKRQKEVEHLENFLVREDKSKKNIFKPDALSIEFELRNLTKKGFGEYAFLTLNDFIDDVIGYGMSKNLIIEIDKNYHITRDNISLDSRGNFEKTPELFFHFNVQIRALQKIMIKEILDISNDLGWTNVRSMILSFLKSFPSQISDDPLEEAKRARILIEIAEELKVEKDLPPGDSRLVKACIDSKNYLKRMIELFPIIEKQKIGIVLNQKVDQFREKVKTHCRENKTLFIRSIDKILDESKITDKVMLFEYEKKVKNLIRKEFGYYESSSPSGKPVYNIVDPEYISPLLLNLARLSKTGESFRKQFEILKLIFGHLKNQGRDNLDKDLTPEEKEDVENGLHNFYQSEKKIQEKEEKKNQFNRPIAIVSSSFTFLYLLMMFFFFKNLIYGILIIPLTIIIGYATGILFSKKGIINREEKKQIVTDTEKELFDSNAISIAKIIESVLYPKDYRSIEDKIYDRAKLDNMVKLNLDLIRNNTSALKDVSDEKAVAMIEDLAMKTSVVIKNNSVKSDSKLSPLLIFSKKDIKSDKNRKELIAYFKGKDVQFRANNYELSSYYQFYAKTLEKDYAKYLKF